MTAICIHASPSMPTSTLVQALIDVYIIQIEVTQRIFTGANDVVRTSACSPIAVQFQASRADTSIASMSIPTLVLTHSPELGAFISV